MNFWIVLHTHRFGCSYQVIESDTRPDDDLVEQYFIKNMDLELDRDDEYLEMEQVTIITMDEVAEELANAN